MSVDTSLRPQGDASRVNRTVVRWLIRETMGVVILAALLFLSAGTLAWLMGWALVILTLLWVAGTGLVVIPRNPELLAERLGPRQGAKRWDIVIMSIVGLAELIRPIVAGLDVRFGWTSGISVVLQIASLVVVGSGYALGVWAIASNAFFSQIVRIQKERGHRVATGGPYRFVRHPGYVGTILVGLAAPIMLGSLWALIPGGAVALLFILRTALEDQTLLGELEGYGTYAGRVRYRLLPGVW